MRDARRLVLPGTTSAPRGGQGGRRVHALSPLPSMEERRADMRLVCLAGTLTEADCFQLPV